MLNPVLGNSKIIKEIELASIEVIRGGRYILGDQVKEFEKSCAEHLGCKYAIGVSSGTDALLLSLMAMGIGPGDEIICPSFTFFATAGSIARVGAKPIFVDILPDCFTIDPESIKKSITKKTKAIIPVHLYGQCADMLNIKKIAENYNLKIIEDAAQAIGACFNVRMAGTWGDVGCFSFFPSKNLGGFGDSGLITTNDDELNYKIRCLRVHGGEQQYYHKYIGGNFRIDTIQAAMLNIKLKYLKEFEDARKFNAQFYQENLKDIFWCKMPQEVRGKHTWNQFTICIKNDLRDEFKKYLESQEIASAIYYPLPLHKQECFKNIKKFDDCTDIVVLGS